MFRPARPRFAPPRMVSREPLASGDAPDAAGPWKRTAALAFAVAAAAVCGCCSSGYGPSPYGGVPGYYGQPAPYGAQPYGSPQFAPQPIPGSIPQGGTILGPPSDGVPPLSAPGDPYGFPEGEFDEFDGPTYDGGFGETPAGGSPSGGGGSPYYDGDSGGYGAPPTGGGTPVPPIDDYDTLGIDPSTSPGAPNGDIDLFDPPPPGTTPDGFQDPLPEDFGSTGRRPGPTAASPEPLPHAPAQPLMAAGAPRFDPAVRPAGAVQPAAPVRPAAAAGPSRTVTGVVDHDPATNTWTLTYSMHPQPTDRFGGALTLIDNGHLAGLEGETGLIVSVEGRVDPAAGPDALGKPRFRVEAAAEKGYYDGP